MRSSRFIFTSIAALLIAAGALWLRDESTTPSPLVPAASNPDESSDSRPAPTRTLSVPGSDADSAGFDAQGPINGAESSAIGEDLRAVGNGGTREDPGIEQSGTAGENAAADESRIAALRQAAAERFYRDGGDELVETLVAHGLARSDSEVTIRRLAEGYVACYFDALRAEADAQSVSFVALLGAVEAAVYDADGPLIGALIDEGRVNARTLPCALDVRQQAGIPPP